MLFSQRQLKSAVGVMVLLGTGWFIGIFMSIPVPEFQVYMQYLFIILNSTQVCYTIEFYLILGFKLRFFEIVTPLFVRGKFLRVTMCNLIVCAFQN